MASSMNNVHSVDTILAVLTEADKFSGSDQLEKLKLLAMAVIPYSAIDGPSVGVVEIYRRIKERHEDAAPAIITRLVDRAGFKKSLVSKLSRIHSCETPPMPLLYFTELLVEISDDLGHTDYLRRLKNRIPDSQLGASREGILTSVQLFKRLLFERTISFDEEIKSLKLLSEWLCDVGRRDIASKIMSCAEEKEKG